MLNVVDTVQAVRENPDHLSPELLSTGLKSETLFEIELSQGRRVYLDKTDESTFGLWSELVQSDDFKSEPLFIEFDESTGVIKEVLTPITAEVKQIEEIKGALRVWFWERPSPAIIAKNQELEGLINEVRTSLDQKRSMHFFIDPQNDRILSAVEQKKNSAETIVPLVELPLAAHTLGLIQSISLARALELFREVAAWICPVNPAANLNCVPYNYPTDCCFARAHRMCSHLNAANIRCAKIWNYGNLCVATANHFEGKVKWWFHVAPIVMVRQDGGAEQEMVIDPSMFDAPVLTATWLQSQNDQRAQQERTHWLVYLRRPNGVNQTGDPNLTMTQASLRKHRNSLRKLHKAHPDVWIATNCP